LCTDFTKKWLDRPQCFEVWRERERERERELSSCCIAMWPPIVVAWRPDADDVIDTDMSVAFKQCAVGGTYTRKRAYIFTMFFNCQVL